MVYLRGKEKVNHQPLVSVCVPTYNYGRFLRDCIESVRAQTLSDWELILCDDCSTDETAELAKQYMAIDSRIRYVRNEQRLGMNANLKRAAEQGRGRYLKILCADDWLAPKCLETMAALLGKHETVVLATCAEIHTDQYGTPLQVQFLFGEPLSIVQGEAMLERMAKGSGFGGNSSFMIRASANHKVGGYDASIRYAGDYHLAARLCRIGDYLHTDEPLFYGRNQPDSSSSQDTRKLFDVMDWFDIPEQIFRPRRFGSREWRRYQKRITMLTAHYTFNMIVEYLRGHFEYAAALRAILFEKGNFWTGMPFLALHIPYRMLRRITGLHRPHSMPPEKWMGVPVTNSLAEQVNYE